MQTAVATPVLIVGAGPAGLSAALMLARHGIRSLLVEQHSGTSKLPKARLVNTRTMEVLRQCGVEATVRAAALPPEKGRFLIRARSVAGEELDRREATFTPQSHTHLSPTTACSCPQNDLEPVLLEAVLRLGLTDVRFSHRLVDFDQDEAGVTATLQDRSQGGGSFQVRASYMIGADGAQSGVRERLGIRLHGRVGLSHYVNILFRADLTPWLADRAPYMVLIAGPYGPGPLLAVNGTDEWGFMALYDPDKGERPEDFTTEHCTKVIRSIVGVADLPVEILAAAPWTASAQIADRYAAGRVFLVGDAAHETTPSGGFGMNTGIQDAHNLAWKLAAVLEGWASPPLLETYEAEPLPVGHAVVEESMRNLASVERSAGRTRADADMQDRAARKALPPGPAPRAELLNERGLIFGAAYASAAVIPDGTTVPVVADAVTDYVPTARPGHRAPHTWLHRQGHQISTLDLFGSDLVLLISSLDQSWCTAAETVRAKRRLPLRVECVDFESERPDSGPDWSAAYGIERDGAVLVRPDGHVAWRAPCRVPDPTAALVGALDHILANSASDLIRKE